MGKKFKLIVSLLNIVQIMMLIFIFSICVVFNEVRRTPFVEKFCIFSLVYTFLEILISLVTVKENKGKKVTKLRNILETHWDERGLVDIVCLLLLVVDVFWYF